MLEIGHPAIYELELIPIGERDEIWKQMDLLGNQTKELITTLIGIEATSYFTPEELDSLADEVLDEVTCMLYVKHGIPSFIA